MEIPEKTIRDLAETFTSATGIGLICLDPKLNFWPDWPTVCTPEELRVLDYDKLTERLRMLLAIQPEYGNYFETFFTEHRFVYNIHILRVDQDIHCFIFTEPMIIEPFNESAIQEICTQRKYSIAAKIELIQHLARLPVVSWDRIRQLGTVMSILSKSIKAIDRVHQSVFDLNRDYDNDAFISEKIEDILTNPLEFDPREFNLYQKVKEIIQSGDISSMKDLEDKLSFGSLSFDQLENMDFLRKIKDYFIMYCITQFCCAIEAGMRFHEMLALAIRMINEVEQMKQISEVLLHMKVSLEVFTNAVHVFNEQRHGKYIMELLSYIHDHYREKITLQSIAEHIGLNPCYLSSLIHKETGLSLSDHINQVRIDASKSELLNTNRPINDIALSVGFAYQNHYAQVFRKIMGMSPLEYRERKIGAKIKNIRRK